MNRNLYFVPLALVILAAAAAAVAGFVGAWAFLSLGFVIGMGHALEADHLAAVGTMLKGREGPRAMMWRGAFWGAGHTLALFAISTAVLALGLTIGGRTESFLELVVGLMIAGLGLRVLWKLRRDRVHIHVHDHGDGRHIHAHSHAEDSGDHESSAHDHAHPAHGHLGTLGIGLVHGAAGSAGLMVLTVAATENLGQAVAYCLVFGLGSMAGMAALTAVASYPLAMVERGGTWLKTATALTIGALAVWVGGSLALESMAGLAG